MVQVGSPGEGFCKWWMWGAVARDSASGRCGEPRASTGKIRQKALGIKNSKKK